MTDRPKHYNLQISVQEVTEAGVRIERGTKVDEWPRTHRDLASFTMQDDDLAALVGRGVDMLYLVKPKESK